MKARRFRLNKVRKVVTISFFAASRISRLGRYFDLGFLRLLLVGGRVGHGVRVCGHVLEVLLGDVGGHLVGVLSSLLRSGFLLCDRSVNLEEKIRKLFSKCGINQYSGRNRISGV